MVMIKHKPRAPGNYDSDQASRDSALACVGPGRTQQHHAPDTDINLIVKRYMQTGILPQTALQPLYGDFESLTFHEAQNKIRQAQEAFMLLPPQIRSRFDNDPGKFVEFASEEENYDELVRLKLRDPKPASKQAASPPETPPGAASRPPDPTPQG